MAIRMSSAKKLVELAKRKEAAAKVLRGINDQISKWENDLVDSLADNGVQSVSVDGRTFYLISEVSTKMVAGHTDEERKEALIGLGLDQLIKPYSRSITAYIKEQLKEHGKVPAELERLWEVKPYSKLGNRKAS